MEAGHCCHHILLLLGTGILTCRRYRPSLDLGGNLARLAFIFDSVVPSLIYSGRDLSSTRCSISSRRHRGIDFIRRLCSDTYMQHQVYMFSGQASFPAETVSVVGQWIIIVGEEVLILCNTQWRLSLSRITIPLPTFRQ